MKKPKKKSKLQKKIDDPNSKLWRNKADKAWKEAVFKAGDGKCAICRSTEWVQAHHLIPREMTSHRHVVRNGILLCASHHKYSFELSPHKAPVAFFGWIMKSDPARWTWLLEQKPSRENITTFKEISECLVNPAPTCETCQKYNTCNNIPLSAGVGRLGLITIAASIKPQDKNI